MVKKTAIFCLLAMVLLVNLFFAQAFSWEQFDKKRSLLKYGRFEVYADKDRLSDAEVLLPDLESAYQLNADFFQAELKEPIKVYFKGGKFSYDETSSNPKEPSLTFGKHGYVRPDLFFEFNRLYFKTKWPNAPLWFSEGLAAYLKGIGTDYNNILLKLWMSPVTYKTWEDIGESTAENREAMSCSIFMFVNETYGAETLNNWVKASCKAQDPEAGLLQVIGRPLKMIELEWVKWYESLPYYKNRCALVTDNLAYLPVFEAWIGNKKPEEIKNFNTVTDSDLYKNHVVFIIYQRNTSKLPDRLKTSFPGLVALIDQNQSGTAITWERFGKRLYFYLIGDNPREIIAAAIKYNFQSIIHSQLDL